MNIGMFTELFPPSVGGQEQRFAALADLLAFKGHSITVMCIRHSPDAPAEERLSSGVEVIRSPASWRYCKPWGGLLPRSPWGMLRFALAVRQIAKAREFDVIFMNQWPLLHILAIRRQDRARAIVDWCEIRNSRLFRALQHELPKLAFANTAVSAQVAQAIRQSAPGRVLVLPSGINVAEYRSEPAAERKGVLYVGRITRHKNLNLLIETFEELRRRGEPDGLTIAGTGPDLNAVRRRVETSPFRSDIEIPGFVDDARKIELLARAKVLILTSQREGFPRMVAEAMASGLPTVTAYYPQNGTVDIVREFGSGLCAEANPDALADAVQAVNHDWMGWSDRSRKNAESLDWFTLVQRFEALLLQAATESGEQSFSDVEGLSCELQ